MAETERRLTILTRNEIQELYGLPRFTDEEREMYFSLSPSEMIELENLRTILSRIYFILQMGYFKAKKRIFIFQFQDVKDDINYIMNEGEINFLN